MKIVASGLQPYLYRLYSTPLEIYELYLEDPYTSISHRLVANNEDITFAGNTYSALGIKRNSIKNEQGTVLNELEIGLDNVDLSYKNLISSGAFNKKRCVVKLIFNGYLSSSSNYILMYDGYLDAPKGDDHWVTMTLKPLPYLEQEYPRRIFQVGCNWMFGSDSCGVNKTSYSFTNTIASGSTISTIILGTEESGQEDNYLVPGYVVITSGDLEGQVRPVASSSSTTIVLRVPFSELPATGVSITCQKLCAKTVSYCKDKYNNYLRYGGFPQSPSPPSW